MRSKTDVGERFRKKLKNDVGSFSRFFVSAPIFGAGVIFFSTILIITFVHLLEGTGWTEGTRETIEYLVLPLIATLLSIAIITHSCIFAYKRMRIVREEKRIGRKNLRSWENLIFAHDDLISRWGNIAMKPETIIEFPLLDDLSDPRMINLYKAFEEADRLRPNVESDDYDGMAENSKHIPYDEAVRELDTAVTLIERATVNERSSLSRYDFDDLDDDYGDISDSIDPLCRSLSHRW